MKRNDAENCSLNAMQESKGLEFELSENGTGYSVKGIGGCKDRDIVIPSMHGGKHVKDIGKNAFKDCSDITSIAIPNCVTWIDEGAFSGCTSLTSINIPDGVWRISREMFKSCSSLASINIPGSVTRIGMDAFEGCTGLEAVYITWIEEWCGIEFENENSNPLKYAHALYLKGKQIAGDFAIREDSVTGIPSYTFKNCNGLTSITIPDDITRIGADAFDGCTGLKTVYITDTESWCGIEFETENSNPLKYAHNLYLYSKLVTEPKIPNTGIGDYAFIGCTCLTSIIIPSGVTYIGDNAFDDCTGLESISVNEGNTVYHSEGNCLIETATKALIAGCKNSVIPTDGSVIRIGSDAFHGCSGLKSITIPDSLTRIDWGAFYGCSGLTDINYLGTRAAWRCISKGADWNSSAGKLTVHCCDGDIPS